MSEILKTTALCAAASASITGESLWMDESMSALSACAPTWTDFKKRLAAYNGSDAQMPGYMAYLWAWAKIFGKSERSLRSANLPWLWIALSAMPRPGGRELLAASAFTGHQVNEARPYTMQIAGGALLLGAIQAAEKQCPKSGRMAAAGFTTLAASSLSGAVIGTILTGTYLLARKQKASREDKLLTGTCMAAAGWLAVYYAGTIRKGKRPTRGKTGIGTTAHAAHELAGLAGLGPNRREAREAGARALLPHLPELLTGTMISGLALLLGWFAKGRPKKEYAGAGAAGISLLALGAANKVRVLGRHLAPLAPFVAAAQAEGVAAAKEGWPRIGTILGPGLLATLGISTFLQRRHRKWGKDDSKTACAIARSYRNNGKTIWWASDWAATKYYDTGNPEIPIVWCANTNDTSSLPEPDVIVLGKPDFCDAEGGIRKKLEEPGWATTHLAGITIHTKTKS